MKNKKEYYSCLRNNNGRGQYWVWLEESGVVETMSASYSYIRTDGATCALNPEDNYMSVVSDIDAVANEYPEIYEEIFYHIHDSEKRSGGYIDLAVYCGEKAGCPEELIEELNNFSIEDEDNSEVLTGNANNLSTDSGNIFCSWGRDYKLSVEREEEYPPPYPRNKNFEMRCDLFDDLLEYRGIHEVHFWPPNDIYDYYCDRYGEQYNVIPPMNENNPKDNGKIEPIKLPIYKPRAVVDYYNKLNMSFSGYNNQRERIDRLIKKVYDVSEQYKARCEELARKLEELGVSRDIRKHAYFDKNGIQYEVISPKVDDPNDPGSFRVIEKDVKAKDDGCDR